jgi:membrane-associated phospholipid phosphatase
VLAVGVARIAIAEHYPTDVIAGLLAGAGDLALFAILSRRHEDRPATPVPAHRPLGESTG